MADIGIDLGIILACVAIVIGVVLVVCGWRSMRASSGGTPEMARINLLDTPPPPAGEFTFDGQPGLWRVEQGCIVVERVVSTGRNPLDVDSVKTVLPLEALAGACPGCLIPGCLILKEEPHANRFPDPAYSLLGTGL